ncbi:MAG: SMP-30/gluconolactonase/LRE family protein [Candidatus Solibacter sp.]|jgi:uncharacterized protein (TIGR03437 family)
MKIRGCSLVVCLGLLSLSAARGQQYTINTIAGTAGTAGFVGDGGAPLSAEFSSPGAVALDSSGNLYIADTVNHCIRKISGNIITTIAGTGGTAGSTGDGAAATSAYLSSPSALAFDSSGNLYIADTGNNVIRKISGTTISTVVGIQGQGGAYGGDLGPATSANLNQPTDIVFDSAGNYYISDNANARIRRVDTSGNITTYVGATGGTNGTSGKLNAPNGLGFDAGGALYIADSGNNRLAKYIPPSTFTNFAGNESPGFGGDGGLASNAQLSKPVGLTFDAAGSIYFTDTNNSRIRKITPDGIITTIAGSRFTGYSGDGGPATSAALSFPRCIAISPNGTIYIADTGNHVIRTLTPTYPAIAPNGVANAASFATRISPGALATVFGSGFGSSTFTADSGFAWPTIANQVSVKVNGVAAPLYYVSPGQINFQVPWATPATGTVNVAVVVNGGSSNTVAVPVGTAAPGLFYLPSGAAIVQNTPSYTLNDPTNPAPAGSTIVAYLTGSGPVSPAAKDGTPASSTSLTYLTAAYSATIGSTPATVSFAGLTPGFIGLVQMNIVVPSTLTTGVYPLSVTIDGQTSNSATIAVK